MRTSSWCLSVAVTLAACGGVVEDSGAPTDEASLGTAAPDTPLGFVTPSYLAGLLDGTNHPDQGPGKGNTVRWNLLPDFSLPSGVTANWVGLPRFSDEWYVDDAHRGIAFALHKGFSSMDFAFNNAVTEIPSQNRYNSTGPLNANGCDPSAPGCPVSPTECVGDECNYLANMTRLANDQANNATAAVAADLAKAYTVGQSTWLKSGVKWTTDLATNTPVINGTYQIDIEEWPYIGHLDFFAKYMHGFLDAAKVDWAKVDPSFRFKFIVYGLLNTLQPVAIDHDHLFNNDEMFTYPEVQSPLAKTPISRVPWKTIRPEIASVLDEVASDDPTAPEVYWEVGSYISAPYPENVAKYQLSGDGTFRRDATGHRFLRRDAFVAKVRGEDTRFPVGPFARLDSPIALRDGAMNFIYAQRTDGVSGNGVGGYINGKLRIDDVTGGAAFSNAKTELHYGVYSLAMVYADFVSSATALAMHFTGSSDLSSITNGWKNVRLHATFRIMTAGNNNEDDLSTMEKQISPMQTTAYHLMAMTILGHMTEWSGYGSFKNPLAIDDGGFAGAAQGQPVTVFDVGGARADSGRGARLFDDAGNISFVEPNHIRDTSIVENIAAVNNLIALVSAQYGFFQGDDKLLLFSDYEKAADDEILAFGRMHADKAFVSFVYPQLEPGESVRIAVSVHGLPVARYTLHHAQVLTDVITLPTAGLSPADLIISYTTVNGAAKQKNGAFQDAHCTTLHRTVFCL